MTENKLKTTNPSKKKRALTKLTSSPEPLKDYFSWRDIPKSPAFIDRITDSLIEWSRNDPDALSIKQFCSLKGIYYSDIQDWKERNERFKKAYEFAQMTLGAKREVGALKNQLNATLVAFSMPHYDKDWKDLVEWRAKLNEKVEKTDQKITVVLESFPSSDRVPEKKEIE